MDQAPLKKEQAKQARQRTIANGSKQPKTAKGVRPIQDDVEDAVSADTQPQTDSKPSRRKRSKDADFWQVNALMLYFVVLIFLASWFFFDVWSKNLRFMQWMGIQEPALGEPILRTIGFTMVGGFLGSVLYQIRLLFQYYVKSDDYDYRWVGKYVSAPWESAIMAMIVLALIRGGVALFGGSQGTDVNDTNNFAAFGVGALVGFGMRDVVGWIGGLVRTTFRVIEEPKTSSVDKDRTS